MTPDERQSLRERAKVLRRYGDLGVADTADTGIIFALAFLDAEARAEQAEARNATLHALLDKEEAATDAAQAATGKAEREVARLRAALGFGTPWPILDVLAKLNTAARLLLGRHNYDGHGWEEVVAAADSAARIHAALDAALQQSEPAEPVCTCPPNSQQVCDVCQYPTHIVALQQSEPEWGSRPGAEGGA